MDNRINRMRRKTLRIDSGQHSTQAILLKPDKPAGNLPGILWIHGGGYTTGAAAMVYVSCGLRLARVFGAVVLSPEYRLAGKAPYPAALYDCYAALDYMWEHAQELGIDRNRIVVGGESAGGGLAAALCIYARDQGKIKIAMQLPLYPMLDCEDTPSSQNNHGLIWDSRRNHRGWQKYLKGQDGFSPVSPYASAARETDYHDLPPCYTYVCRGEPFFCETVRYVRNLQEAGIPAQVDIFPGNVHAFDIFLFWTKAARTARNKCQCAFFRTIVSTTTAHSDSLSPSG